MMLTLVAAFQITNPVNAGEAPSHSHEGSRCANPKKIDPRCAGPKDALGGALIGLVEPRYRCSVCWNIKASLKSKVKLKGDGNNVSVNTGSPGAVTHQLQVKAPPVLASRPVLKSCDKPAVSYSAPVRPCVPSKSLYVAPVAPCKPKVVDPCVKPKAVACGDNFIDLQEYLRRRNAACVSVYRSSTTVVPLQ